MAVVPRRRKSGTVYGVVNEWNGKPQWELVGRDKRAAGIRDRAMQAEIKAGTYRPPKEGGAPAANLWPFAKGWGDARTNAGGKEERRQLRLYLEPRSWLGNKRICDITHADMDKLHDQLLEEVNPDGSRRLSDKTIANFFDTLKQVFKSAIRKGLCSVNPIMLEKRLSRAPKAEREVYTKTEAILLTRHHSIPEPIRVLNALCLLAGLREGEACGRRWRDISDGDLPAMEVRTQYNDQPLKTKRPRVVPVHPELQKILLEWATTGFAKYVGRPPQPDDFIVPNRQYRALSPCWARTTYYKAFIETAQSAGVRPRTLHSTRHTFITLCRRGGAPADVLERVTHNKRGEIIDWYTHLDWDPLCKAVLCLNLDVHRDERSLPGIGGNSVPFLQRANGGSPGKASGVPLVNEGLSPVVIGDSRRSRRLVGGPRQESRQGIYGNSGDHPERTTASVDPTEEAFAVAVAEDQARADVAALLARPLSKVRPPVPKRVSRRAGR